MTKKKSKSTRKKVRITKVNKSSPILPYAIFLIIILTGVIYFQSFSFDFTNWDDNVYVTENPQFTSQTGINLRSVLSQPTSGNYHPVTMFSLSLDYLIGGLNPQVFHLHNLLLHLANILLVYFFILRLSSDRILSLSTAFIFALHPMHVESVAWVSERKDVLYVFYLLLGLLGYLAFDYSKKKYWLILSFLFALLSMLSKAMAVIFPLLLLLVDYYKYGSKWNSKKRILQKIPFFGLSLAIGLLALKFQGEAGAVTEEFTAATPFFGSYGLGFYIVKFLVPFKLSAFYPYASLEINSLPIIYYLAPGIWIIMGYMVWRFYQKDRKVVFGILFYVISVILVLQFLSVGQAIVSDRYTYLSYIGLSFSFVYLFLLVSRKIKKSFKTYWYILGFSWLGYITLLTYQRIPVWRNSETLWNDVIRKYPNKFHTAYKNLGNYYGQNGQLELSKQNLEKALSLNSKDADVYESLGNIAGISGDHNQALAYFNQAINIDPEEPSYYINRAITYSIQKSFEQAFRDYEKSEQLGANLASFLPNRAFAYLAAGKYQESVDDYNQLVNLFPNNANYHYHLSKAYFGINNLNDARKFLELAKNKGFTGIESTYESRLR